MEAPTKKRPGRPLEFGRPVSFRLSPAHHAVLATLAARWSVTPSDALRRLIEEAGAIRNGDDVPKR